MSQIISEGNNSLRPKIFQEWPKNPLKFYESSAPIQNKIQKKNESLRAEQALHRTLMTSGNIKSFLQTKEKLQENYRTFVQQSLVCKRELQDLSTQKGVAFDIGSYEQSLRNYYVLIRKQSKFMRQAQTFCLSNLSNFDPKQTGIRFSRPQAQSHKELLIKVAEIERKRNRLQQSLVLYEQGIPRSEILGSQFDLQTSLQDLKRATQNENLTQLHFLMLYEVNEANEDLKKFAMHVEGDKQAYATYEAIGDSLNLMLYQRKQMKKDRKQLEKTFENLNCENAANIVPASGASLPILLKNQKVYQSNVDLLARYNAQTNLNEYATRRNKYSSQIAKYSNQLTKWEEQQQACAYLYNKQEVLDNYNKKRSIENSQMTGMREKTQLKLAYVDALNCPVPLGANEVHDYKISLLKLFGNTMQRDGIVAPQGTKLIVSNISNARNLSQEYMLQKYFDFFMQLKQQPIKNKANLLIKEKNNINAMLYELGQQGSSTNSTQQYEVGLQYCHSIAQHASSFNDRAYLEKVELISKRKWTGLPIGLSPLIFNYTCDVLVKNEAENYIAQVFSPRMSEIEQNLYNQLNNLGQQKQLTQMAQLQLNLTASQRRQFFFNYYHKLSDYSQSSKKKLSQEYWKIASMHLSNAYNRVRGSQTIKEVDKKNFFTFQVLSYLATNGAQLKLNNFKDTIDYYLDYMNKYDYYRLDQRQMFIEIAKQRIFIEFLKQKIIINNLNLSEQLLVMEKINQSCIILYQINDHALMANTQDVQIHLQHSLKLEKAQNQFIQNLPSTYDSQLVTKMNKISKSMRKNIISGSKLNIYTTQLLINTEGKLKKFEKVNNLKQNIGFLSTTFTRSQNALQTIQNLNSFNYSKADVITITEHQSKSIYLLDLFSVAKNNLIILKPQLDEIMSIYEGEANSRMQDPRNNIQTNIQKILNQIANKLRKMAFKN